jgi:hypothetical protein
MRFSLQCPSPHPRDIATTSSLPLSRLLDTEATHLLPGPQTIVLLELALVVRYTVLAEDPAISCQYRAVCGKPRVRCSARRVSRVGKHRAS